VAATKFQRNNQQEKEIVMIRTFFIVAGLAALAVASAGSIASAKMSGSPTGNNGSTVPKVDAKPGPINKNLGLHVQCIRRYRYDKLGVFITWRECTLQ
jgi:hypothetical protein